MKKQKLRKIMKDNEKLSQIMKNKKNRKNNEK